MRNFLTGWWAVVVVGLPACQAAPEPPWRLVQRPTDEACAYVSAAGDTVIPFGRYDRSVTERFDRVAIVHRVGTGWVGIDRQERVLFHPYLFDNGPDYPAEGVLRIVNAAGLLGYADTATGRVVVPPRYEAAFPFEKGRARVGRGCHTEQAVEHSYWTCATWSYINHQGQALTDSIR
ncbi:WG repeat-containing protein [Hymenobacter aerilatus]|uniref:WG repeat-containing protein n=1 Tax=Hymenobacter aerilatus TaxID=2932251 RepID=A0A8T9T3A4_9BACT|nr:WG repeat-containing protein [Hymenobacter aerilatus]UOR06439.1 WG repeat-containing protein [Hymenobacter aerilatus]